LSPCSWSMPTRSTRSRSSHEVPPRLG
jgi:hypothetical protein